MKRRIIFSLFFGIQLVLIPMHQLAAVSPAIMMKIAPSVDIPIGQSSDYFKLGGGGTISATYRLALDFPILISADLGYNFHPIDYTISKTLHLFSIGAGVGTQLEMVRRLPILLYTKGGYYYGRTQAEDDSAVTGGNPYISAGGEISYRITPRIDVGFGGAYRIFLGKPQSLLNEIAVFLGTSYRIPLRGGEERFEPLPMKSSLLRLSKIEFYDVFPIFYQYYDDHPIGHVILENKEKADIKNLKVSVFIKRYMDNPKMYEMEGEIGKGETKKVDLYALFTDRVLEITEGTKVSVEIKTEYDVKGVNKKGEYVETLKLHHRNASIWDDDRRAAAFVTARDPAVLRFSKSIAGLIRSQENRAIDPNLRTAMALHQALFLHGVNYVVDPKTPYKEFVQKRLAIDFLQFPRQTLEYKAGDCDDLSILYCALFESVSIDTAFITVPGHIYVAFRLKTRPEEAQKLFREPNDLIVWEDQAWVPIEVTEIQGGFLTAWEQGAKMWRENSTAGQANFYPLAEAWRIFEPVGFPGEGESLAFPRSAAVERRYLREFDRFIHNEIDRRVASLQQEIQKNKNNPRLVNKLGVLYARFGLLDEAKGEFNRALSAGDYLPALVNMGNVLYLRKDLSGALAYYDKAKKKDQNNPTILLNIARIHHELENYGMVKENYERLARVSPGLAEEFKYLALRGDEAARAAESGEAKEVMLWEE